MVDARDGGAAALRRRTDRVVRVYGAGRVGATAASLLSAAGVGRVEVEDRERVRPGDLSPGGHTPATVGDVRELASGRAAAAWAVRRRARTTARDEPDLPPPRRPAALPPPRPGAPASRAARAARADLPDLALLAPGEGG